jgi:hypothetical protein
MSRCMLALAFGGALLATACANLTKTDEGPTSVTFNCDDDKSFLAMFSEDRQRSFIRTEDDTYELALVDRDGDELEYQDGEGVQLIVDEDDGRLRVPDEDDYEDCTT